jgi:hypothetical protein
MADLGARLEQEARLDWPRRKREEIVRRAPC